MVFLQPSLARRTIGHRLKAQLVKATAPMRIRIFALAVLLVCGWLTGCRSSSRSNSASGLAPGLADDKSPVIVEINGSEEHLAAFDRFVKARLSDLTQDPQNQADNDKRQSGLFDEFVQRQVILQEAKKKGIEPTDEEIRNALESQHKQTSDGADRNPATLDSGERRIEIFNDLMVRNFHEKAGLLKDVKVTPQEIEEYYKKNSDRYQSKNGFYVREIRVQQDAEAQKLYRQALAKPQDFAVLAKEHSDSPTAAGGGLMLYEAQQLPPVLEQAITPLKVGSISKVVSPIMGSTSSSWNSALSHEPWRKQVKRSRRYCWKRRSRQLLTNSINARFPEPKLKSTAIS